MLRAVTENGLDDLNVGIIDRVRPILVQVPIPNTVNSNSDDLENSPVFLRSSK